MEPSKEAINLRLGRLANQLWSRGTLSMIVDASNKRTITRESLLDALTTLYDECNKGNLKKDDIYIANFIEKYRSVICELKQLRVNISDFEIKDLIGRGHFGEVHVIREKHTGDVYAMKTLKKEMTLKHISIAYFEEERDIMALSRSDWIIKLKYAFQDTSQLYLIMEYCPGGDLAGLLDRLGKPLPEKDAVFYIAEIIQALHDVHNLGFIHRDVKPDNILLDRCGHLKLADFGSAARISSLNKAKSLMPIGTTEYISPEILMALEKPDCVILHGTPCDYWSLGIVAFELLTLSTPFRSNNTKRAVETYKNIIDHANKLEAINVKYPDDVNNVISNEYKDMIKYLLHPAPEKRPTYQNLLCNKLFKNMPWKNLREQLPPFVPIVNSQDDVSNFLELDKQQPLLNVDSFRTKSVFSGKNLPFIGFTYSQDIAPILENGNNLQEKDGARKDSGCNSSAESVSTNGFFNNSMNGTAICLSNIREMEHLLESRKKEIEFLHKKVATLESKQLSTNDKEKKLLEIEKKRLQLENDLAAMSCLNQKLKNQLETEHKGREVLENKSLQLIRSAKDRWKEKTEEQISSLKSVIATYEKKHAELEESICNLQNQLEVKTTTLTTAQAELETFKKLQLTHKDNMSRARRLSRQSIIGIEQMSQESNTQMLNLTQNLNKELDLKKKLNADLKVAFENLKLAEERENNLLGMLRSEKDSYTNELMMMSNKYDNKCHELSVLTYKSKELEEEYEKLKENEKKYKERANKSIKSAEYEKKISTLESQIELLKASESSLKVDCKEKDKHYKELLKEKSSIQVALNDALACEEKHKGRVTSLEDMLSKLQDEVVLLENLNSEMSIRASCAIAESTSTLESSDKLSSLEEEVKKLQEQLKTSLEETAQCKKDTRKAELALYKKEKELSNCDLDRRIAVRELKQAEERIKSLQDELKKEKADYDTKKKELTKYLNEKIEELSKMQKTRESMNLNLESLKTDMKTLENNNVSENNCKMLLQQKLELEIKSLKENVQKLQSDIETSEKQRNKAETVMESSNKEFKEIMSEKCSEKEKRIRLEVVYNEKNKEFENLLRNYKMLQEASTILEEQLIDFENAVDTFENKNVQLTSEIETLQAKMQTLSAESLRAQKLIDMQKFSNLSAEIKNKEFLQRLEEEQLKSSELEKQVNSLMANEASLSKEVKNNGAEIVHFESELKQAIAKLNTQQSENAALKEECTQLLTNIADLREDNMQIKLELKELKENNTTLRTMIKENEEEMSIRQFDWHQRELKAEATISQQIKLIDFLQMKIEEVSKKKKTIGDMLFGKSSAKENIMPPLTPQTPMKFASGIDYSKEVQKEKLKNRELQEQLAALQSKLKNLEVKSVVKSDSITEKEITSTSDQILMDDWVKIQRGALLTRVNLKLYSNIIKWSGDKNSFHGQIQLIKENSKLQTSLSSSDTDIVLSESELKSGFKVMTSSNTTCWPNQCLLVICSTIQQKETWLSKLQGLQTIKLSTMNTAAVNQKFKSLVKFSRNTMEPNCLLEIEKELFLIGSTNGLFCYTTNQPKKSLSKINGIKSVSLIRAALHIDRMIVLFSCGELVHCSLRQFNAVVKSVALSSIQPSTLPDFKNIDTTDIDDATKEGSNCNMFEVSHSNNSSQRIILCAATCTSLIIYNYDPTKMSFIPMKTLKTDAITCMRFTEHTIIVASHRFYEIDLKNFNVEEFLDPSDMSLCHAVFAHKKKIFPIAIVQTKNTNVDKCFEYLLCYSSFGIFVDEFGQRSRANDVKWSHLPLHIVYRKPYLFVSYLSAIEMIHLTDDAYEKQPDSDNSSISSKSLYNQPDSLILDFHSLQYLGKSMTTSSIYVMALNQKPDIFELLELNGNAVFRKHFSESIETLDTIDDIDSCKSLKCGRDDTDSVSADDSIEIRSDFAAHIREKAKVINSLNRENNKLDLINKMLSQRKESDSDIDSSDEASDSSFNDNNKVVKTNSMHDNTYMDMNQASKGKQEKSTEDIVSEMFLDKANKHVRFN